MNPHDEIELRSAHQEMGNTIAGSTYRGSRDPRYWIQSLEEENQGMGLGLNKDAYKVRRENHGNNPHLGWTSASSLTGVGGEGPGPSVQREDNEQDSLGRQSMEPLVEPKWPISSNTFPHWLKRLRMFLKFRQDRTTAEPRVIDFPYDTLHRSGRHGSKGKYPANVIRNQKYHVITFLVVVVYEQFKFFFNLYFLAVALSQFVPVLQIGPVFTSVAPLVFVLSVTCAKEAADDYKRYRRDQEANGQRYVQICGSSRESIPSAKIRVGDLIVIGRNQRVPADMILLRTADTSGTCFIRTDQLDGETDWKLRQAISSLQKLPSDESLFDMRLSLHVEHPHRDIHTFAGTLIRFTGTESGGPESMALTVENTLWANTVVATGTVLGLVIYTGRETRAVMNTSQPSSKVGLVDLELNRLSKMLFFLVLILSLVMVAFRGFYGRWWIYLARFSIMFSSIIPVSLRMNLDLGKTVYSMLIMRDHHIPEAIVRNSTIPEELGRIGYLLSDKTGTLTRNEMEFKKLHLGAICYARESMEELARQIHEVFSEKEMKEKQIRSMLSTGEGTLTFSDSHEQPVHASTEGTIPGSVNVRRYAHHRHSRFASSRLVQVVQALAICHNVTPVESDEGRSYQAASPDEMAIVKWTESVGVALVYRDMNRLHLQIPTGQVLPFEILHVFPFTSERKRMGIVVREVSTQEILFYMKGADSVMSPFVQTNDWLDEECENLAREGLRTLVVGMRRISQETYDQFRHAYHEASIHLSNRTVLMEQVLDTYLEQNLELLGVTGVEDKLQDHVKPTLEALGNAGIRIWMLTGDKVETACTIALSSRLVSRRQSMYLITSGRISTAHMRGQVRTLGGVNTLQGSEWSENPSRYKESSTPYTERSMSSMMNPPGVHHSSQWTSLTSPIENVRNHLEYLMQQIPTSLHDTCIVLDGASLQICLDHFEDQFMELALHLSTVVCCRCSPQQKADITHLLIGHEKTRRYGRVAAVGDGGNDVSMIQAAHVGIGIVGKEGKQASLAADFSILQFGHLQRLILYHGRNCYKRSAALSQFIIHRGLIFSIIQAIFCAIFYFAPIALYQGFLLVGYTTIYTMAPVFSLVLDEDVRAEIALLYPELYRELLKGRALSYRTFFTWVLISVYQAGVITLLAILLFGHEFVNIVAISFTALILNELLMVALEINTWHRYMIYSEVATFLIYLASMGLLQSYFDMHFILSWGFVWRVGVITLISFLPLYIGKCMERWINPPSYIKLT